MIEQGLVREVVTSTLGSLLAADAVLGAEQITVESVLDFNEDGGDLTLNGDTYTYLSADYSTNVITLASGLSSAAVTMDQVNVAPVTVEKDAFVAITGADDLVTVRVPHSLMDRLVDGIRLDGEEEAVQFEWVDGQFLLRDVLGREPVIDGAFIDPATLPATPSDGNPPSASPTLTAQGNIGAIHYRWTPVENADPVKFNLYVSTTSGFTPGPGNLVAVTAGSSFSYVPSPLDYTATYYAVLVEFDDDGDAAPSPEVSAQLRQATNEDISAAYAYLGQVLVDQLTGGTLNADILLASTITSRSGGSGAGIDIGQELTRYDSASQPTAVLGDTNVFKGNVEAEAATFTGDTAFRGQNEVSTGAAWTLQEGTTSPTSPPVVQVGWPLTSTVGKFSGNYGLAVSGTKWVTVSDQLIVPRVIFNDSTPEIQLGTYPTSPRPWGGLAQIGTDWYTLGYRAVNGITWYITKYDSSGNQGTQDDYTPLAGAFGSGGSQAGETAPAAIGSDGTNVLIAEFDDANNRYRIQVRDATTLAVTSTIFTTANAGFTGPVTGIVGGNFDFGSFRYVILSKNGQHAYPFTSTGTYQVNEAFSAPSPGSMTGITWISGRFWTTRARLVGSDALLYGHSSYTWTDTTDPKTHHATTTWRDTNATGGTHETDMGAVTTFQMKKRAGINLTSAAIPAGGSDDPNAVSFYLSDSDTARTSFWLQDLPDVDGDNFTVLLDNITFTGTNPPAANDFPSAVPAQFKAAKIHTDGLPRFYVDGAGAGRWLIEDWHIVGDATTGLGTSFQNGWSDVGGAFPTMRFGKDRFGFVWLWGRLTHASPGTVTTPFTLPAGYRPPAVWPLLVRNTNGGSTAVGMNVNADGTITLLATDTSLFFGHSFPSF